MYIANMLLQNLAGSAPNLPKVEEYERLNERSTKNGMHRRGRGGAHFIFLVGLEGTGHHLYSKIVMKSPSMKKLIEWKLAQRIVTFQKNLFNNDEKHRGIFSALCDEEGLRQRQGERPLAQLEHWLKFIDASIRSKNISVPTKGNNPKNDFIAVPLNFRKNGGSGLQSYPNHGGACRSMQYPHLDMLYEACDSADVDCSHIFLYRDLHETLRSTTMHRDFMPLHSQLGTFLLMSSVIFTQMTTWRDRLLTCWNYNDFSTATDLGSIFGWEDPDRFRSFYTQIFDKNVSANMSTEDRFRVVPEEYSAYMRSLERTQNQILQICENEQSDAERLV